MPRRLKPATIRDVHRVRRSLHLLRDARDELAEVGASRALQRVRAAITSTEGALRHVERRAAPAFAELAADAGVRP